MNRSVLLFAALLLAGCAFPYTLRALPPGNAPATDAAPAAAVYVPPRQIELADTGQRLSQVQDIATAPLPRSPRQYGVNPAPFHPGSDQ